MWRDFNIADYAETRATRERPSSAVGSSHSDKENVKDTWSPVITIPKPFKMTLREANKKEVKKTKVK